MRYWLVMPAAGAGRRFGGATPKQYAALRGRTVFEWSLAPFLADSRCAGGAIAFAAGDTRQHDIAQHLPTKFMTVPGGPTRVESVRNALDGLAGLAAPTDWVLVHDAARPCISAEDVQRLLTAGLEASRACSSLPGVASGAVLAVPVTDTLKRCADSNGSSQDWVQATVSRDMLWRSVTPQMFRHAELRDALTVPYGAGGPPTDEAEAIERLGGRVRLVVGLATNVKVTTEEDLKLAEAILAARSG